MTKRTEPVEMAATPTPEPAELTVVYIGPADAPVYGVPAVSHSLPAADARKLVKEWPTHYRLK